jgi:predicted nucleotidyltransferase
MFKDIFGLFRPQIPEEAQKQANQALDIIKNEPKVKQVRIFGSAANGKWNEHGSDIDVFVQIEGRDPDWAAYNQTPEGETPVRKSFRKSVKDVASKVELHIATDADIETMKKEGGERCADGFILSDMHKKMLHGRLIYKK